MWPSNRQIKAVSIIDEALNIILDQSRKMMETARKNSNPIYPSCPIPNPQ